MEAEPVEGFLNLPAEIRLQIYGELFAAHGTCRCSSVYTSSSKQRLTVPANIEGSTVVRRPPKPPRQIWSTFTPVTTAILRVNKQIHAEALPVMWENIEWVYKLPANSFHMDLHEIRQFFARHADVAGKIRKLAFRSDSVSHPQYLIGRPLEDHVRLVKAHLPKLQELRIHFEWTKTSLGSDVIANMYFRILHMTAHQLPCTTICIEMHHLCYVWGPRKESFLADIVGALHQKAWAVGRKIEVLTGQSKAALRIEMERYDIPGACQEGLRAE